MTSRGFVTPWLVALAIAALAAPGCRLGYEELEQSNGALGGENSAAGGDFFDGGSVADAGDAGAPSGSGNVSLGGTGSAGEAGAPMMAEGGGPSAPSCDSTTDCTCEELDGHSYWFCKEQLGWNEANAACQTASMTLVRIDRATENDFVLTRGTADGVFVMPTFYAHIGANDQDVTGEWRWVDGTLFWQGSTLVKGMYANWDSKSPSNMTVQRCSGMLATGLWQDRSCTALAPFICESP